MFYGNRNLCFFGHANPKKHIISIPIIKNTDGRIQLEAGQAHGIYYGDKLELRTLSSEDDSASKCESIIATVTRVGALSSDMKNLCLSSCNVENGWIATPLTSFALRNFPIRLEPDLLLPGQLRTALGERQSLGVHNNMNATLGPTFSLIIDRDKGYIIRDETDQQILYVPTTTLHQEGAVHHVLDVMEHLTRFKLVRGMTNIQLTESVLPFSKSFPVQLINTAGQVFEPGCLQGGYFHPTCYHSACVIDVKDGEKLKLVVENKMDGDDLHLRLYSLGYCWEIEDMLCGNHEVVPSKQKAAEVWTKKIKMDVPHEIKEKGQPYCEDIFKLS